MIAVDDRWQRTHGAIRVEYHRIDGRSLDDLKISAEMFVVLEILSGSKF